MGFLQTTAAIFFVAHLLASAPRVLGYSGTAELQWSNGGCNGEYCEYGWYSSPAVGSNGSATVIFFGAYSWGALLGATGATVWKKSGSSRIWPDIVLAKFDGSTGSDWIITGNGNGEANVVSAAAGTSHAGFPAGFFSNEARAVVAADLTGGSGPMQVVIGRATGNAVNTAVLNNDGSQASGWPQPTSSPPYSWGIYNHNFGVFNMDGDAALEIISPSDVHYVNVFNSDGSVMNAANPPFFDKNNAAKAWGTVPFCLAASMENSYCDCESTTVPSPTRLLRTNFADGPVTIADLDNDGLSELVFVGRTYDFCTDPDQELTRFNGLHVLHLNRTRWATSTYDWTTVPEFGTLTEPVTMDYNVLQSADYAPVTADLDGDGKLEILFSGFDGKLHAFWLDRTEHCNWPYLMNTGSCNGGARFSSPPVVADLDNDGYAEVIVSTWGSQESNDYGSLLVLSSTGNLISTVNLPVPPSDIWRNHYAGAMASPTLADVLGDSNLEVVLNTIARGVVVYTLPGSSSARVLWRTGRGSYQRTGVAPSVARTALTPPTCPAPDAGQNIAKTVTYCQLSSSSASVLSWFIFE